MKPRAISVIFAFLSFALLLGCGKNDMNTVYVYTTTPSTVEEYTLEVNAAKMGKVPYSNTSLDFTSDSLNYKTKVLLLQRGKHTLDLLNSKMNKILDSSLKIKRNGYGASSSGTGPFMKMSVIHTENKFMVLYEQ